MSNIKIKASELKKLKDRILVDKKGQRYVLLSDKKRVKVKDDISERQLLIWLIKHLKPRRRRKTQTITEPVKVTHPVPIDRSSSYHASVVSHDALTKLKEDTKLALETLKKEQKIEALPAAIVPALPAAIVPALPAPP